MGRSSIAFGAALLFAGWRWWFAGICHGGVVEVVAGAHVELVREADGVTVYIYDEDMRRRWFIWGEAGFFGGPFATLEPRWDGGAFAPLHFDPTAHQVFLLSLQLDPQLKPEGMVFEVPPGPTPTDADHGGEIVEVGDLRIEHLVADGRDLFWFTDRHGHSRISDVLASVRVGDCDLEPAGIGDYRASEAPDGCIGEGPFTIEAEVSYRETLVARFPGRP
ncbi:MAG: hypothetical protein V4850_14775 [Myxococcota bacterium]